MKILKRISTLLKIRLEAPINYLSHYQWGWLAGLIDGDGCIGVYKKRDGYDIKIVITTSQCGFAHYLKHLIGQGEIYPIHDNYFNFEVFRRKAVHALLFNLRLILKERQRKLALRAIKLLEESKTSKRDAELDHICIEIQKLNSKGKIRR